MELQESLQWLADSFIAEAPVIHNGGSVSNHPSLYSTPQEVREIN